MSWYVVLGSFLGAGGALVAEEVARRKVQRSLARAELARDGLHEMLSFMTALEGLLPQVAAVRPAATADELADTPSAFTCTGPLISYEKYLECFDDEEVHRLVLLIFERHQGLQEMSERTTEAFAWLLEHADAWNTPMGREAQGVVRRDHASSLTSVRELLRFCSELCTYLIKVRSVIATVFRRRSITDFIKKHYDVTPEQISERAGYYQRDDVMLAWRPEMPLLVRTFRLEHHADARGRVCLTYEDDERIVGSLNRPLAIRRDESPVRLYYCIDDSSDWLPLEAPDVTAFRSYSDVETVWMKAPGKAATLTGAVQPRLAAPVAPTHDQARPSKSETPKID